MTRSAAKTSVPGRFNRYPMLYLAICFAAGILASRWLSADIRLLVAVAAVLGLAALALRKHAVTVVLIWAAFFVGGILASRYEVSMVKSDRLRVLYDSGELISGSPVEVEGVMLGRPEASVDSNFLTLRAEKLRYHGNDLVVSGNVRIFVPESELPDIKFQVSDLKYGSRIRVACNLMREDEFLDPGVQPKREILDRLGIDAIATIKSGLLIEHVADESVFIPLRWVYDQRAVLIDDLRSGLDRRTAGVMIASLLGDRYFLDKDTANLFREGGTFHILVISGLHITFIGGLLLLFLRQFTRNRWLQFVVTTTILWGYALAVGADVPVVRATLMFTILLFSYAIYRQGTLLNSLGTCAFVLLAWRPSDLFNPSFQLTIVSVGAIIGIAYPLVDTLRRIGSWTPTTREPFSPNVPVWRNNFCEMLYWREGARIGESKPQLWSERLFKSPLLSPGMTDWMQRLIRYFFEGVTVSFIVQICILPLTITYFHRVSIASVFLNLWVGFFIAFESFAAVAGAVVSHFSTWLAVPLFAIADTFNWLLLALPRSLATMSWASFRLPAYSGAGRSIYFIYYIPVIILAIIANLWRPFVLIRSAPFRGRRFVYCTSTIMLVLFGIVVFHPFSSPRPDGLLHVDFLDVGQGDSALVTFPGGETLLVDGGGHPKYKDTRKNNEYELEPFQPDSRGIGDMVVSEFLWYRGYSHIDHILATHADADHIQGLGDVARNFGIGSAYFGRTPLENEEFVSVADVLRQRGVPVEIVARGDVLRVSDVTVEVLYPMPLDDPNAISDNNHCVVLRITYGGRVILMTGDIERQAEADLLAQGTVLAADLIKAAHHGSRTSSTQPFIDATGAKYAVISVGRHSPFGHPHPDVVDRWQAAGALVMTTGERGTISVSTDGRDLQITRFVPGQ